MDDAADAGDPVYLSAISPVEIVYLVEKGRLPSEVIERLRTPVLPDPHAGFTVAPLDERASVGCAADFSQYGARYA